MRASPIIAGAPTLSVRMQKKQRIALFSDSPVVDAWVYSIVEWIRTSGIAQISFVILTESPDSPRSPFGARRNLDELAYLIHSKMDGIIFHPAHNAFARKDLRNLVAGADIIQVRATRSGSTTALRKDIISRLGENQPDVILHLGSGPLSKDLLEACKCEVWSYFHGDVQTNRGVTPGYLEVVQGIPGNVTGLMILGDDPHKARVIVATWMATRALSITKSNNKYFWKTAALVQRKIRKLSALGEGSFLEKAQEQNPALEVHDPKPQDIPSNLPAIKLAVSHSRRLLRRTWQRISSRDQWFLLWSLDDDMSTSLGQFKKMIPAQDRFWADPFVVFKGGKYYIFIEEFVYSKGKGHISVIEMDENGNYGRPRQVLVRDYHLSYPFVFSNEDKFYLIPETANNKTIELYECVSFPYEWKHKMNLKEGITAVDTTLLHHNERWWMFTAVDETGEEIYDELSLFSADSVFSTDWREHPLNPVVSDSRSARPAGRLFSRNGKLYRPSQDCAGIYGSGIVINEVKTLDESNYQECEVTKICPGSANDFKGIHTIAFERRLTVLDGFAFRNRLLS